MPKAYSTLSLACIEVKNCFRQNIIMFHGNSFESFTRFEKAKLMLIFKIGDFAFDIILKTFLAISYLLVNFLTTVGIHRDPFLVFFLPLRDDPISRYYSVSLEAGKD